ncbi:MAG: M28 family metallopeptidase [Spirochaetaceae bacterium]|nr:M28 family metallopeptidase [Spirochaetaceae bacterium]
MNDLPPELKHDLTAFTKSSNRFEYIRQWLKRCGIEGKKIETQGLRHLLVRFNGPYDQQKKVKTLVAHYDKLPFTPAANDNSAAVFQLMCHAGRLAAGGRHGNTQILFTDGEEIIDGPLSKQGSYQLATIFKNYGISNCQFYVFDMCGIGDCLVLGGASSIVLEQAMREGRIKEIFYHEAINELAICAQLIKSFQGRKADWIYALFSDDLGFLLNGYPAVFFSTLPSQEAAVAHQDWKKVFNSQSAMDSLKRGYLNSEFQNIMRPLLPKSWQTMHTIHDTVDKLEKRAFVLMEEFLNFISFQV